MKAIQAHDTEVHAALDVMYRSLATSTLKRFRRKMPPNKQPMNWSLYAHRAVREMKPPGKA